MKTILTTTQAHCPEQLTKKMKEIKLPFFRHDVSSMAFKVSLILGASFAFATSVVQAQCVGTFFCSIYQKYDCEALGCVWTGDFLWGSCSRGPDTLTCEDFTLYPELCQIAQGCTYMTQCIAEQGGAPVPACRSYTAVDSIWGTPLDRPECSDQHAQSNCQRIDGCVWVGDWLWGHCEGTPEPCETYSTDPAACSSQQGCAFSYDPPKPDEPFCEAMLPMNADLKCLPDDTNCEKCRDTVDGHVCFYSPGMVLAIENEYGYNYCWVEECPDFTVAFDCGAFIDNDGPEPKCVGQDCDGNCIYKAQEDGLHSGSH